MLFKDEKASWPIVRIIFSCKPEILLKFDVLCEEHGTTRAGYVRNMIYNATKEVTVNA